MSQNHPHDNIYSILGKLQALEPTPAEVIKDKAQVIRESVEAQGSILAGLRDVSTTEQRLAKMFEESKFDKTTKAIEKSGKSKESAKAIAATIGREKLGQKEMTRRSVAGKKKANESQLDELSYEKLNQYKNRAVASANQHDAEGNTNKADQRYDRVAQATGKIQNKVKAGMKANGMNECAMCEAGTCTEHGVAEGHADQVKRVVKQGGKPVGEIGIDPEASPGGGQWYVKHYASGYDVVGFNNAEEALAELEHAELKHCLKQGVAEGSKPDFLDLDHDGNEKESMKKAAKDNVRVHKGTYGTSYDPSDEEKKTKTKHVPRTGQKGRPKKDVPMKASVPADPFGRTTGEVPKGKKGTKISGKGNIDTVNESMNFQALAKKHGMGMDECMNTLNDHYNNYKMTGECSDLLNGAMQLHRHHMDENKPVAYEVPAVQRKAMGAPKLTPQAVQQQDAERSMHPGMTKLDAPKPAAHDELDELAKLAGLTDEGAGVMHYKDEKAKEAGEDHFTLGGKTFPVKENFDDELANIIQNNSAAVEHFKQGGEMDYDLESDLWEYYFNKGEIRNYDADASEFISQRFAEDLGIDEGNAFGLAVQQTPPGEEIKIDGKPTGEIKKENAALHELAKLAGLQVNEMNEAEDTCCCDDKGEENCPVHGHDHLDEADAPVDEPEEEPMNTAHKVKYQSMKGSTMGPGEGDPGEKRMYPKAPDGDNAMTQPARGMPIDGKVQESILELEAQLLAEYESIKK